MHRTRSVLTAGMVTICVLALLLGLLTVGVRSQQIMTGQTLSYRFEAGRAVITSGEQTLTASLGEHLYLFPYLRLFLEWMRWVMMAAQQVVQKFPIA